MTEIDINQFKPASKKIKGTGALYSHKLAIGTLNQDPRTWYCKEISTPAQAKLEVLAQEFFRVIIPYQPETRIAKNYINSTFYVLSEKVSKYDNLPCNQAERFKNYHYKGLGQVMAVALFLEETDLKNGNIGIDSKNRVIKIDGDWCFSEFQKSGDFKLTTGAIEELPYPVDYPAYNWLDIISEGKKNKSSKIVDKQLSHSLQYRAEVNKALFKICLLPDTFIESFVDAYIPAGGQRFVNLLKARRDELQASALYNASFLAYLKTSNANEDAKDILLQMKQFKCNDQFIIAPERHKALEKEFKKGLHFADKICAPIIDECNGLLTTINKHRIGHHDPYMDEALQQYKYAINHEATNPKNLSEIKNKLTLAAKQVAGARNILKKISAHSLGANDQHMETTLQNLHIEISKHIIEPEKIEEMKPLITELYKSACCQEIRSVKNAITAYRNDTGFFNFGKKNKAQKIETALYNTPVEQRGNLISSNNANSVQEALATHRYLGKRGDVYKTKDGKIDYKQAPKLFKSLKKQHSNNEELDLRESRSQMNDEIRPTKFIIK